MQEHFLAAPSDALAGEKRVISVRVTDYPDIYDTSEYITVRVRDPDLPGVKCRIASYDTENFTALTPGDELSVPVKLLPARERNGQSVDTYAAQGIFLRATATGAPEITGRWDFSFLYAPKALCRAIGEICRSVFPPDVQPFLTALLTGDKTDLYDDGAHYYALADAGLAHVVAVSGMHIAFLMGFLFLLIGRRPWAVAVSLPVLLLFAAMTGFTPSVTRAAVMQFFLLAAPLFGRESDGVTSLLTALALLLLLNPSACASVSLQLSFSSVAGIWFLSNRMYRALSRRIEDLKIAENRHARRVLLFAAGSVSSSIGAMALSAPLTAVHFGSVSVVSPISNILCLWIVSAVYIGCSARFCPAPRRWPEAFSRGACGIFTRCPASSRASRARTFMCAIRSFSAGSHSYTRSFSPRGCAFGKPGASARSRRYAFRSRCSLPPRALRDSNGAIRSVSRRSTSGRGNASFSRAGSMPR